MDKDCKNIDIFTIISQEMMARTTSLNSLNNLLIVIRQPWFSFQNKIELETIKKPFFWTLIEHNLIPCFLTGWVLPHYPTTLTILLSHSGKFFLSNSVSLGLSGPIALSPPLCRPFWCSQLIHFNMFWAHPGQFSFDRYLWHITAFWQRVKHFTTYRKYNDEKMLSALIMLIF